jgi:hypothetical protein
MSFGREMDKFIEAFNAGMKVNAVREDIMSSRQKRGIIDDPMGPGNYTPGTGGGVGETTAPDGSGGGKTGGGGKGADIAWKGASPQQRALLMTISGPESAGDYSVIYGGDKHITDFSKHPGIAVPIANGPNKGKTSSAAGRYQFLGSTWNNIASAYHLPDFSPENQDKGVVSGDRGVRAQYWPRPQHRPEVNDPKIIAGIGNAQGRMDVTARRHRAGTNTNAFVSTYQKNLTSGAESAPSGLTPEEEKKLEGWSWKNGVWSKEPSSSGGIADSGIPEEGDDQQDVGSADISMPEYTAPPEEPAPQVENEFDDMNRQGFQQGGAIPDDMGGGGFLQFADGGNINPARDYTQNIAAPTVTMAPRINAKCCRAVAEKAAENSCGEASGRCGDASCGNSSAKQSGYQLVYNPRYAPQQRRPTR